jgi:hypothetical protein
MTNLPPLSPHFPSPSLSLPPSRAARLLRLRPQAIMPPAAAARRRWPWRPAAAARRRRWPWRPGRSSPTSLQAMAPRRSSPTPLRGTTTRRETALQGTATTSSTGACGRPSRRVRILERHPHHLFAGDVDHMRAHRGEASRGGEVGRRCEEGGEPAGAPLRGLLLLARSRRSLALSSSAAQDPSSASSILPTPQAMVALSSSCCSTGTEGWAW